MRRLYLFAFFFVIYELTVYSANDMIMPGMIQVVEHFNADQSYVALSLSYYILGNCALVLIAGLLAERFGKRNIIMIGNLCFLVFTILIVYSQSIQHFMFWRFLEGSGLAIIGLGYAMIHENFDDKRSVKLIALMANITLLAPLVGPMVGSLIVSYLTWHYVFIITAIMSAVTLVGLYSYTPESPTTTTRIDIPAVTKQYWQILKSHKFLQGVLCIVLTTSGILIWISQAPNLIFYKLNQNYTHYVMYQLFSVSGMALASIAMQYLAGKYRIYSLIKVGSSLILAGVTIGLLGTQYMPIIVAGQFISTFGLGLANGCIMRLIMSSKEHPRGMIASLFGFIQTLLYVVGIGVVNTIMNRHDYSLLSFTLSTFIIGLAAFILVGHYLQAYRERGWE